MSRVAPNKDNPTAGKALDIAQRLAQTRGFNGFSYADIATELGITKASLHYHFASKAELGRALVERYAQVFKQALLALQGDAPTQLTEYVRVYEEVLVQDRMCLCGMLAAEYATLPKPMQDELRRFFDMNDAWLSKVLERGRAEGQLLFEGASIDAARSFTASLEGSMLLSRSYEDIARFRKTAERLLAQFGVKVAVDARATGKGRSKRRPVVKLAGP